MCPGIPIGPGNFRLLGLSALRSDPQEGSQRVGLAGLRGEFEKSPNTGPKFESKTMPQARVEN